MFHQSCQVNVPENFISIASLPGYFLASKLVDIQRKKTNVIAFIIKSIYQNKIVFRSSSISGPFEKFDESVVQTDWNRYKQHVNCTFEGPGHASVVQVNNQMDNTHELFWSWNALILHESILKYILRAKTCFRCITFMFKVQKGHAS